MNQSSKHFWPAQAAYALLLVAGVLAGIVLVVSASRYVRSTKTVASLDVAVTGFHLFEDSDPRAELTVGLSNPGALGIAVDRFTVTLTLDGEEVGSTQQILAGSRQPDEANAYAQQTVVGRMIGPDSPWEGQIVIYFDPSEMTALRRLLSGGASDWSAETGVFITPPFSGQREHIVRSISLQEPTP